MKIKVEMEINSCKECPFTEQIREHGYSATECRKLGAYATIADKGFRKDCPFLKENKTGG